MYFFGVGPRRASAGGLRDPRRFSTLELQCGAPASTTRRASSEKVASPRTLGPKAILFRQRMLGPGSFFLFCLVVTGASEAHGQALPASQRRGMVGGAGLSEEREQSSAELSTELKKVPLKTLKGAREL